MTSLRSPLSCCPTQTVSLKCDRGARRASARGLLGPSWAVGRWGRLGTQGVLVYEGVTCSYFRVSESLFPKTLVDFSLA